MCHPIDVDEKLLIVADDIEVLNAPNFLIFRHFDDYSPFI